jgi:hypothetical protein
MSEPGFTGYAEMMFGIFWEFFNFGNSGSDNMLQ